MTLLTIPAPRLPAECIVGVRVVVLMGESAGLVEARREARRAKQRAYAAASRARHRDAVNARRRVSRALRGREADPRTLEERRAADRASYARNRRARLARMAAQRAIAKAARA